MDKTILSIIIFEDLEGGSAISWELSALSLTSLHIICHKAGTCFQITEGFSHWCVVYFPSFLPAYCLSLLNAWMLWGMCFLCRSYSYSCREMYFWGKSGCCKQESVSMFVSGCHLRMKEKTKWNGNKRVNDAGGNSKEGKHPEDAGKDKSYKNIKGTDI